MPKTFFAVIEYRKGNNSGIRKNMRKSLLDSLMGNVMPKFRICRLNGVVTFGRTYTHPVELK